MMKLKDPSFHGLSDSSIRQALKGMAQRAPVAGLIQAVLYPSITMTSPELNHVPWIWLGCVVMVLVCFSRLMQLKWGESLLAKPGGLTLWRIWFGFGAQGIALTWGLTSAYTLFQFGMTPLSGAILVLALGTLALYSASYPLDLPNNFLFQTFTMAPPVVVVAIFVPHTGPLAIGGVLYLVFSLSMALNLRKSQVQLLNNVEILEQRDKLIRTMLASIDEVFLIFDASGNCMTSASSRSQELLAFDPKGLSLAELLRMQGQEREELETWYNFLFSDRVDFDSVSDLGPKKLDLENGMKRLSLRYHAMRDNNGALTGIVLTAMNATREMIVQKELNIARERADLILNISANRLAFRALFEKFENLCLRIQNWNESDYEKLRFDLHSLKGNSFLLGAAKLGQIINKIEIAYQHSNATQRAEDSQQWAAEMRQEFQDWQSSEQATFEKLGLFDDSYLSIPKTKLASLKLKYAKSKADIEVFRKFEEQISRTELAEVFEPLVNQVQNISQTSGKNAVLTLVPPTEPVYVSVEDYRQVLGLMVHLLTNAIEHGIESAEVRTKLGKPVTGNLSLHWRRHVTSDQESIVIEFRDDGGGVDTAKIRNKLIRSGVEDAKNFTEMEIANRIFDAGLSSRDQLGPLSGHGLGLAALRTAIIQTGGKIEIVNSNGEGTTFVMTLPRIYNSNILAS